MCQWSRDIEVHDDDGDNNDNVDDEAEKRRTALGMSTSLLIRMRRREGFEFWATIAIIRRDSSSFHSFVRSFAVAGRPRRTVNHDDDEDHKYNGKVVSFSLPARHRALAH